MDLNKGGLSVSCYSNVFNHTSLVKQRTFSRQSQRNMEEEAGEMRLKRRSRRSIKRTLPTFAGFKDEGKLHHLGSFQNLRKTPDQKPTRNWQLQSYNRMELNSTKYRKEWTLFFLCRTQLYWQWDCVWAQRDPVGLLNYRTVR